MFLRPKNMSDLYWMVRKVVTGASFLNPSSTPSPRNCALTEHACSKIRNSQSSLACFRRNSDQSQLLSLTFWPILLTPAVIILACICSLCSNKLISKLKLYHQDKAFMEINTLHSAAQAPITPQNRVRVTPKSSGMHSQKSGGCFSSKGGPTQ